MKKVTLCHLLRNKTSITIFENHKMNCYPVTDGTDFSGMSPHAISRENPYQCKLCTKSFGQCGDLKKTCENTYRRNTLSMQILYKIFFRWWTFKETFENTFRIKTLLMQFLYKIFCREWIFETPHWDTFRRKTIPLHPMYNGIFQKIKL